MAARKRYPIPGRFAEVVLDMIDWYKRHKEDYSSDTKFDWAIERLYQN